MDANQLSTLCHELATRVERGKSIDEGLMADLFMAVCEIMCGQSETTDELDAFLRDLDASYVFNDLADNPVFCAGACWGAFGVYVKAKEREADTAYAGARFDAAARHAELLATIRDNPGITQQDLGKALGKSKSNLAQILARLETYRLFIVSPSGKYKRYRISTIGCSLLDEIEREAQLSYENPHITYRSNASLVDEQWLISGLILEKGDQAEFVDVRNHNMFVPISSQLQYEKNNAVLNNMLYRAKPSRYLSDGAGRDIENRYVPVNQSVFQSIAV